MDFTSPERNQFAFYLEGAEAERAHRGFEHTAQYLNLAPGAYTFWVKRPTAACGTSNPPRSTSLCGHPGTALGGPICCTLRCSREPTPSTECGCAPVWTRPRSRAAEGHGRVQNRFFTNITHEFRTPLTVILGMVEWLTADGGRRTEREVHNSLIFNQTKRPEPAAVDQPDFGFGEVGIGSIGPPP